MAKKKGKSEKDGIEWEEESREEAEWEEVKASPESLYWIPEHELDSIVGVFRGFVKGQYGDNGIIELEDGTEKYLPSNALLNSKLRNVKEGYLVKIVYTGMVKLASGRYAKDYKVFVARGRLQ